MGYRKENNVHIYLKEDNLILSAIKKLPSKGFYGNCMTAPRFFSLGGHGQAVGFVYESRHI
jgi:hypothetical protein